MKFNHIYFVSCIQRCEQAQFDFDKENTHSNKKKTVHSFFCSLSFHSLWPTNHDLVAAVDRKCIKVAAISWPKRYERKCTKWKEINGHKKKEAVDKKYVMTIVSVVVRLQRQKLELEHFSMNFGCASSERQRPSIARLIWVAKEWMDTFCRVASTWKTKKKIKVSSKNRSIKWFTHTIRSNQTCRATAQFNSSWSSSRCFSMETKKKKNEWESRRDVRRTFNETVVDIAYIFLIANNFDAVN